MRANELATAIKPTLTKLSEVSPFLRSQQGGNKK